MGKVTVTAPEKVNRRIAGVTFSEGRAEVDTDSAAFQFFRRRGFTLAEEVNADPAPVVPEPVVPEPVVPELVEPVVSEPVVSEPVVSEPVVPVEPVPTKPERPHPVQGNKAAWFDYLSKIKPDHGFDLEKVQRKELIETANEVDGITAE